MDQTEEALGYAAEGKKFAEEYTPPDVSIKDVGKFVAEMTPIVGDAMAAKEVYDELQKEEPNYYLAGALGGAALVGLIPGLGDVAAKAIRKGAREVFDVAKRVDVDMNAMGSGLGNVRLKPAKSSDAVATGVPQYKMDGNAPASVFDNTVTQEAVDFIESGSTSQKDLLRIARDNGIVSGSGTGTMPAQVIAELSDRVRNPNFKVLPPVSNSIWSYPKQMYDSAATSINASKNAKGYNTLKERGDIKDKDLIVDIGGGRFNNLVEDAAEQGATVKVYDPFNRTPEHNAKVVDAISNGKSDMAMSHNVLNVIKEDTNISDVIKQAENAVKPGGKAHFSVYEGDSKDRLKGARQTSKGWQRFQTTDEYVPFVENVFGPENVVLKDKIITATKPIKNFNEGGMTMRNTSNQTVQAFALGGEVEEFDPVSGNEVPPGSFAEEVRDDIPAQLSEGEYVVPADVVRFHGVKLFEELRAQAKMGFSSMEAGGRIGGQPVSIAVIGDELPFDTTELKVDDDGEPEPPMMNKGGYMTRGYDPGGVVENPVLGQTAGVTYVEYTNDEGKMLLIPFFNGVPMAVIPDGYYPVGQKPAESSEPSEAEKANRREDNDNNFSSEPTAPAINFEELTGKELEQMVKDQQNITGDLVSLGIGAINPVMGLFVKLGMADSARRTNNEIQRRVENADNPNESDYYANLLEVAKQDEPGFLQTLWGNITNTFKGEEKVEKEAEDIKAAYTPEEFDPESNRGKYGYSAGMVDAGTTGMPPVPPPPQVTTTFLNDVPNARDEENQDSVYDKEAFVEKFTSGASTSTVKPAKTSVRREKDNTQERKNAMKQAASRADENTKRVVAKAEKNLATKEEIDDIKKEGARIKRSLTENARGIQRGFNKGGLMKKKKK